MAAEKETAAIVLDCRDQGESDAIVTFFCRDTGRLAGIAKGAKRSKHRFVNKLELFSSLQLTYSLPRHGSLAFIAAAELRSAFLNIRHNIALYNAATVLREFVLMGTGELERDERIFDTLLWALQGLDEKRPPRAVVIIFLIRFLGCIGYRPDFSRCGHCSQPISAGERYGFSTATGGLICDGCAGRGPFTPLPISQGTIRLLTTVQSQPLERLHRLQFSLAALEESLAVLHRFSRRLFQRDIHSWGALKTEEQR